MEFTGQLLNIFLLEFLRNWRVVASLYKRALLGSDPPPTASLSDVCLSDTATVTHGC